MFSIPGIWANGGEVQRYKAVTRHSERYKAATRHFARHSHDIRVGIDQPTRGTELRIFERFAQLLPLLTVMVLQCRLHLNHNLRA